MDAAPGIAVFWAIRRGYSLVWQRGGPRRSKTDGEGAAQELRVVSGNLRDFHLAQTITQVQETGSNQLATRDMRMASSSHLIGLEDS